MSLFATDATLLGSSTAVAGAVRREVPSERATATAQAYEHVQTTASIDTPDSTAVWSARLPVAIEAALRRGHVRAAALLHEAATSHLSTDNPALLASRSLIDGAAAADAAIQQRQLAGDALVIPSLTEVQPGHPRFFIGLQWNEMAHPIVQDVVTRELSDGSQAELRNFLDESLCATDTFLDLEPGIGIGLFTALSAPNGVNGVYAVQRDPGLHAILRRNIDRSYPAATVALRADRRGVAECVRSARGRLVAHVGTHPLDVLQSALAQMRTRAAAVILDLTSDNASASLGTLDSMGFRSFVLVSNAEEIELLPFEERYGAQYVFALSSRFIDSVEVPAP